MCPGGMNPGPVTDTLALLVFVEALVDEISKILAADRDAMTDHSGYAARRIRVADQIGTAAADKRHKIPCSDVSEPADR
jgi:hypothetical protein